MIFVRRYIAQILLAMQIWSDFAYVPVLCFVMFLLRFSMFFFKEVFTTSYKHVY